MMDCLILDGNETLISLDTWMVVFENKTIGREPIANWIQGKLTVFGSILSIWIVVANLFLCFLLARHSSKSTLGSSSDHPSKWIRINIALVQALIGGVSIPVNLVTYAKGRWIFGRFLCNASLLGQMFLVSNSTWAMVAMVVDLFYRSVWLRSGGPWWTALSISGAWAMSSLSILPMVLQLEYSVPQLFPEVCAVVMTKQTAVLLSLGVFLLPAAIAMTGSVAFLVVRWRISGGVGKLDCEKGPGRGSRSNNNNNNLGGGLGGRGVVAASVAVVTCSTVLWSPFFVVNAVVSFCVDMCVEPWLWSLFLWSGYSSSALHPLVSMIDGGVRHQARLAAGVCCPRGILERAEGEEGKKILQVLPADSIDRQQQTSLLKDCTSSENDLLL